MSRIISTLLALALCLGMVAACGKIENSSSITSTNNNNTLDSTHITEDPTSDNLPTPEIDNNTVTPSEDPTSENLPTPEIDINTVTPSEDSNTAFDIVEFINLDWKYSAENNSLFLTKNDILDFDKTAYYYGPTSIYAGPREPIYFYILSEDRTLFGYEGLLEYSGSINTENFSESIISEPDEYYGTLYEYVGNGDEVPFSPNMYFTVPNVTLSQFLDIINEVSVFTGQDTDSFLFVSYSYTGTKTASISELNELLSIEDTEKVIDDPSLSVIVANGVTISDHPEWYIGIRLISQERHLLPHFAYDPLDPWEFPIINRLTITLSKKS